MRESEQRLIAAQHLANLGDWWWDVHTGEVNWSDEVYKTLQLDPEAFTPRIDSILPLSPWPEDHQRDQEPIQRSIESRETGSDEQRFVRPDGSTFKLLPRRSYKTIENQPQLGEWLLLVKNRPDARRSRRFKVKLKVK